MKRFFFLIVAITLGFAQSVVAQQLKSFTHDNTKYIEELQGFFAQGDPKAAKKLIEETFEPVWNSGHYSPQQKNRVYEISDLMLKKRKKGANV